MNLGTKAKVNVSYFSFLIQYNIIWFQLPVKYSVPTAVAHCCYYLHKYFSGLVLLEVAILSDIFVKMLTFNQLHDNLYSCFGHKSCFREAKWCWGGQPSSKSLPRLWLAGTIAASLQELCWPPEQDLCCLSTCTLSQHVHCCRTPTVVGPLLPRQLHTVSVHRNCRASTGTSCPQYLVFHCYRIPTFTRTSSVSGLPLPQHIDCRRTSAVPTSIPLLQDLHFLRTSTVKVLHCLSTPTVAGPPLLQDLHCSLSQHLHQRAWCFHVFWAGALVRPITSSDLRKCFSLTI